MVAARAGALQVLDMELDTLLSERGNDDAERIQLQLSPPPARASTLVRLRVVLDETSHMAAYDLVSVVIDALESLEGERSAPAGLERLELGLHRVEEDRCVTRRPAPAGTGEGGEPVPWARLGALLGNKRRFPALRVVYITIALRANAVDGAAPATGDFCAEHEPQGVRGRAVRDGVRDAMDDVDARDGVVLDVEVCVVPGN